MGGGGEDHILGWGGHGRQSVEDGRVVGNEGRQN